MKANKRFDALIDKVEQYFGDVICEYGYAEGADEEMVCSGEWEPSQSNIKSAMVDVLCDFANLTGEELTKCADYWYKRDYGR